MEVDVEGKRRLEESNLVHPDEQTNYLCFGDEDEFQSYHPQTSAQTVFNHPPN